MQVFRDLVHGLFGKVVLGVVIALFVLYGTEALLSLTNKPSPVAEVNDAQLYRDQLANMVEQQKQAILRQNPNLPPDFIKDEYLRSQVAQRWVERSLIEQALIEWGVRPHQQAVIQQLQTDSRFAVNGEINQELLESWLRANGLKPQVLFDDIRTNLGLDQLVTSLKQSEFLTPKQVQQVFALQSQTREFKLARISADAVKDQVKLKESALKEFYDQNLNAYMEPAQATVQYITFDPAALTGDAKVEPQDAELQSAYNTYLDNLKQEEKRQSSHILIDTANRSEDEAQELAQSVYDKIQAGEDFSALAKEFSDDKPSAEDGGSLPLAEPGTFVPPFEDALYALKVGEVSQPVKTDFGYHIIKLDEIEAAEPESFEDKKAELVADFQEQQQADAYRTVLDDAALLAFESANLEAVAEKYNLKVEEAQFNRESAPAPLNNEKALEVAFSDEFFAQGRNSDLIELDESAVLLFPVKLKPAAPQSFAQVKDEVKQAATEKAAIELAADKGRAVLAKLKVNKSLSEDEQALIGEWQSLSDVDRRSSEVSAPVIQKLFSMPKPAEEKSQFAGVGEQRDFVLLELQKVSTPAVEESDSDSELEALASALQQNAAQSLPLLLVDALKDGADIVYSETLLGDN